ncbi:MAG: hypothetical protein Q9195_001378 [Heterodermia aff. obscurata]
MIGANKWLIPLVTHVFVALSVLLAVTSFHAAGLTPRLNLRLNLLNTKTQPNVYSPLDPFIEYVIDKPPADSWSNDLYFGPPSNESEIAWNRLIHPHGIQIYPEEAEQFEELRTVQLKNGNHVFILGLYHNFHCLRRIRQTLRADYYYPDKTPEWRRHDLAHTGHCLEAIRTSMMCHPDLTPNRYFWSNRTWHDLSVAPDVTRKCVNWDVLNTFMKKRKYDPRDFVKEHGEILDHY